MKNIISTLILTIAVMTFTSCNKDSIIINESPPLPTGETVSGTAFYLGPAGTAVNPMVDASVYLGDSLHVSSEDFRDAQDTYPGLLLTFVDKEGNYIFEGVIPKENQVIRIFPQDLYTDLEGVDNTLDGDNNEELTNELIQISIEEDEVDDGNDFTAWKHTTEPAPISISGFVYEDTDMDLIGDTPITSARIVLIDYELYISPDPLDLDKFPSSYSQENGYYEFRDIPPGEYVVQHITSTFYGEINCISSMDQSPEAGEPEISECQVIAVNLTETDPTDYDNVFVFSTPGPASISGYTLEDTDMDLMGDAPIEGNRLELYERGPFGFPTSPDGLPLAWTYSDQDGYFEFRNIPNGEYVIYHIGSPDSPSNCVSNMDQSPEAGEPEAESSCTFIPVNLTDMVTADGDNIYVFSR